MVQRIRFSSIEFYVGLMNMAASFSLAPGAAPIAAVPVSKQPAVKIEPSPIVYARPLVANEARV